MFEAGVRGRCSRAEFLVKEKPASRRQKASRHQRRTSYRNAFDEPRSRKKYRMPREQQPGKTVAGSSKRIASRFYQVKTGHCLTGQYLEWTKNQLTAKCWWCSYRTQTREHVFKNCPGWREQQRVLWVEVREEAGRGRDRFKIQDLLADKRCSRAVLDLLSTTDVGEPGGR
jgi:hypothetical protein